MIELKFKWDESNLKLFKEAESIFAPGINKAIVKMAFAVRNTAIKEISHGARSGRLYKRGRIRHRASQMGEFPKTDTGRLVNSIRINFRYLEAEVGSDLNYAGYLEYKKPEDGGRPWLSRSRDMNTEKFQKDIMEVLKRTFKL